MFPVQESSLGLLLAYRLGREKMIELLAGKLKDKGSSAPRREVAHPSPPVAVETVGTATPARPSDSGGPSVGGGQAERAPEQPAAQKSKRLSLVLLAAAALVAAGGAAAGLLSVGAGKAAAAERRQRIDAFYAAQREPAPPARCQETDSKWLKKIVAALSRLPDSLPEETKVAEGQAALGALAGGSAAAAESAYFLARAQIQAGVGADEALAAATACPGFAAAENLAGRAAFRAGRREEAERRFRAAMVPGFAKASFNLALVKMGSGGEDEAFALLKESVAAQPDWAEAHFALGKAHEAKSAQARREGKDGLAEAEDAQAQGRYCRAAELGFEPARKACRR